LLGFSIALLNINIFCMKKETKKSKAYRERVISIDKAKEIDN
jgi:hypothetical protein